jgi:RNase P subunit RPR2
MKKRFHCPECRTVLNPNVKIVLAVKHGKKLGLILLSPQPGNYRSLKDANFCMEEGKMMTFLCPACNESLTSNTNKRLASMVMSREGHPDSIVEFSRVCGEHATFIVDGNDVTGYGEDTETYESNVRNFFGS